MTESYKQLGEQLPERSGSTTGSFPIEPKAVARWVEELPRANPQVTLARLADAFGQMRHRALSGGQRAAILDMMRPVVLEAIQFLDRQLQTSNFPLTPQASQAAEACLNLHREMANGYRAALHEALAPSGSVSFLRRGATAQLLVRAALHHVRLLSLSYFLYRMPLPGVWFGLHSVYRFARVSGLASKSVDEPHDGGSRSVEQLYLQSVLLALSNPFRFSQREQQDLWPISRELVGEIELLDKCPNDGAFAVPVMTDRGPGYIPEEREGGVESVLWLDLAPLRALLEAPLQNSGIEQVSLKLKRQKRSLGAPAELMRHSRRAPRPPAGCNPHPGHRDRPERAALLPVRRKRFRQLHASGHRPPRRCGTACCVGAGDAGDRQIIAGTRAGARPEPRRLSTPVGTRDRHPHSCRRADGPDHRP
jgi:hypothetical protein